MRFLLYVCSVRMIVHAFRGEGCFSGIVDMGDLVFGFCVLFWPDLGLASGNFGLVWV